MVPGTPERGLGFVPGPGLQIPLSTPWALPVLWLLLRKTRPLRTVIPTKLAGKFPTSDQGTPQDLIAEERGPGSPRKVPQLQEVCGMRYVPVCVGSGRGVTSSTLHSCVENQHLKPDPSYFQNSFFSAQKL